MQKKIAVLNFSGNVGKTNCATSLLKPRMADAQIFSVESLNVDASSEGLDVEKLKGKAYGALSNQLLMLDSAIVDVGASNVEDFLKMMQQYDGSHEDFDYFLIPTVKEKKQQQDTVNTIRALSAIGVAKNKIRVVFNKVELDDDVSVDFGALFGLAELEKSFTLKKDAVIYRNDVYEQLKTIGKTLGDVSNDQNDYRQKLREATSPDDKEFCVKMIGIKRLAVTATKNMDDVFKALFK
ncbi:plasmid stabilization protein [Pseudomonas sp. DCB_CB]|uniref:StbB family protein n=1 Tax=unclassified Pseudomonas TaxID=196821 RepID=UPI002248E2C1|nr:MULTISPECIES: StbB family protein [unclassified Pseudomonas]MCX2694487.1 plasmid stabilization protein [Pseudomonas sp. DCB_BZ]MCX2859683.1 plasmid stabilization protein [Pseudomonas sp. DCB_CB]